LRLLRLSKFTLLSCLVLTTCLMAAESPAPDWSIVRWLRPASALLPPPPPHVSPCAVESIPPITDPEAIAFEESVSPATSGLVPAMTRALTRFQQLVSAVGGTFVLKSAYRPPAYQAHLQQVWNKWMEIRNNSLPACQVLRAEVEAEFKGHHLIETQKPVDSSDHTRGLAFDATVEIPTGKKKKPVNLDRLAMLAGIMRPDVLRDPVHFKLIAPRLALSHAASTE
jgi:hypothetical protein